MNNQPVYPGYFADPFAFAYGGSYYAVGTGDSLNLTMPSGAPGVFLVLRSSDLREWTALGPALEALEPGYGNAYWAPEIAVAEGKFWMYYSVGIEDKAHGVRVAVSETPEGPYRDTGARLTNPFTCPFAIDASPFQDEDGCWYLFYATDFLDSVRLVRPGTALAVDRLLTMTDLAGAPRTVARARHDWQRFAADRVMYGARYDWHTLEGPCVRKRGGRYWCLYSAGRWENDTYGVDYLWAEHPLCPWVDESLETGPRLLRTIPGRLIGPGHNSIVTDAAGQDYIVYHAWDVGMTARSMFIEPLEWTADGPRVVRR